MILSMTGFAAAAAELPGISLAVELRSVNHRYLDVSLRMPDELRGIEAAVTETLAGALRRGKVECRLGINRTQQAANGMAVDVARIEQLAAAAVQVTRAVPGAVPLSVSEILRWPGVLAEPTVPPAELAERALALLDQALAELSAARGREGAKTAAVLEAGGSAGKRLDFLMQELHREANTLGSKSVDAELSQASLEMKVLIEQMREQVQNLE